MPKAPRRAFEMSLRTAVPRVLAVVVTHNGSPWLRESLESVAAQDYAALDVVVVDNGSDFPAQELVVEILPDAEFLPMERNIGFGAAANRALEHSAKARQSDYFLFLHDDAGMEPECVSRMVAAGLETGADLIGGKGVSWEQPNVLLEVGMSADQLCYPFTGLEEGEIDQGQHDTRRETLFVTSACCLVSRTLFERCGAWDGAYFAFGEDLDLCLRARLAGLRVIVEPAARFRHAVGLASGLRDAVPASAIRFYTRRNRLRTIVKTAATFRMWLLLPLYFSVISAEIVALSALRRFEEIPPYLRAVASFVRSLPGVLRRRTAVQKRREVRDRQIRRLMVRDSHRVRVFAERRLREWGGGTIQLGERTLSKLAPARLKSLLYAWLGRPSTIAGSLVVLALFFSVRHALIGEPLASGTLWPFPTPIRQLLRDYVSGWRDVGLGTAAAAPPALPILWIVGVISFGNARLAQAVLLLGLLALGLAGIHRFAARRTISPWARLAAVAAYALAPVVGRAASAGDLSALALFAGVPYLLLIGLRMLGPTPAEEGDFPAVPLTTDVISLDAARLALATALVVALAPSGFVAIGFLFVFAGAATLVSAWGQGEALRRAGWVFGSLVVAAVLLMPWTLEGMRPGSAILGPVLSGLGGGPAFRELWSGSSSALMVGLTPGGGVGAFLVAPAIAAGALLLGSPSRRREARLLTAVWLGFALVAGLAAKGRGPAPVASPEAWAMIPVAIFAALAAHLAAAVREELPRHAVGWRHVMATLVTLSVAGGAVVGWLPSLGSWQRPSPTLAAATGELGRSISSFFITNREQVGDFRILWLGHTWVDPIRAGSAPRKSTPYLVTGPEGLTLLDVHEPHPGNGEVLLERNVESLVGPALHHAGHLLAPGSIRYVVVDVADATLMAAMLRQRDFALEHQQSGIAVFRNIAWIPRAVLAPAELVDVAGTESADHTLMLAEWSGGRTLLSQGESFSAELPRTRHPAILLGDNFNSGWKAWVGPTPLSHTKAFGWTNRFDLPADALGEVTVSYRRQWSRRLWLLLQASLLALVVAMIRLRRYEARRLPR
jgi:GT2 family glycosyltransferase